MPAAEAETDQPGSRPAARTPPRQGRAPARAMVYERMWEVLSGAAADWNYSKLSPADRRAIVEILLETKKDLPAYFKGTLKG